MDAACEIAAAFDEEFLAFCKALIRTPSLSGEEGAVAGLVERELERLGYDEVFTDDWGNVCGLVHGAEKGPVLMFNGHMDVVTEGDAAEWGGYDPYGAAVDAVEVFERTYERKERTEALHGRGASDMKCGLAAQIYAGAVLAEMKRRGIPWKGTFLLAAVVLEENAEMMGTIKLTEGALPARGIEVDAMVAAEPSSLDLKLGHRGRLELKVTVRGRSCHGSSPWLGVNAVEKAAKLICAVERHFAARTDEDPRLGRPGIALTIIECFPAALCIVPDRCEITYDRRLIPGETVQGAVSELRGIAASLREADPDFDCEVAVNKAMRHSYTGKGEEIESSKEVWIIDEGHPFIRACAEGLRDAGQPVRYGHWAFSTDIPQVAVRMGKPCVGYGAGQEPYIHSGTELIRLDYLRQSLAGNVGIFLRASGLPKDAFTA
jgi:putative selenium metabolism hydrolase